MSKPNLSLLRGLAVCTFICSLLLPLPILAQGVVVLAGGGREGDQGDTSSWSYKLYRKLVENGDRHNDGVVQVAILTTLLQVNDPAWYSYAEAATTANPPGLGLTHAQAVAQALADDAWLPNYFQWLGSTAGLNTQALNVEAISIADANDASRMAPLASADVVFIKGGDQGEYFDKWNGTLLESHIRTVVQSRGGAVGGTSAGAMSQAQYCFCGGSDLISSDVMSNAKTSYLDDVSAPGTSAIHSDFLAFVPGVVIDTHYTQRGRMGRLIGILARAIDDSGDHSLLGIGLDQKTGLVIQNGVAEVIGNGEAAFFKESPSAVLRRDAGRPLFYSHLVLDRLSDGWKYDLTNRAPITTALPPGVVAVSYPGDGAANVDALSISGSIEADANRFESVASFAPSDYALLAGTASTFIKASIGYTNVGSSATRAAKQEGIFRALFDAPEKIALLAFGSSTLSRTALTPDVLNFGGTQAAVVIDAKSCTFKGLSPVISSYAIVGGTLRTAALTNLRVHVLAESAQPTRAASFDTRRHLVLGGPPELPLFRDGFEN
jgi:cyanophycinase